MNFSKPRNGVAKASASAVVITLIFLAGMMTERYTFRSSELAMSETVPKFGQVKSASYVIFKEGSTYYARNGKTETIDYSGTNATQIIQDAIDTLPLIGGKILLREGTYQLSAGLTLKSYMTLSGSGINNTVLLATSDMTKMINIAGLSFVTITDLWLHGDYKAVDGIASEPYNSGNRIRIVRVRILNMIDDGIFNGGGSGTTVLDSYITGCDGHGIDADGGFWNVIGNIISRNGEGITVFAGATVHIVSNYILSSTTNGIRASNAEKVTIQSNKISSNTGVGVYVNSNATIKGNLVKGNGGHQIYLGTGSNGTIIDGNRIINLASNKDGIRIQGIWDIVITNNIFYDDDGGWGIQEGVGSDYNIITGNNARDLTKGIRTVGSNTHVNLCWNGTNWIS